MRITITKGDIFEWSADYIVNPANTHLRHGGGLARAIAERAEARDLGLIEFSRPEVHEKVEQWAQDHADAPAVATGDAYLTSAGMLPYLGVIHAVGPIWKDGTLCEEDLLCLAHISALRLALRSTLVQGKVLFPAISCGIFGFPVDLAAHNAIRAVEDVEHSDNDAYGSGLDVVFVLGSDEHYAAYEESARRTHLEVRIV